VYQDAAGDVTVDGSITGTELIAANGIVVNSATVSANYTIPTGSNAMSAGAVTIADGITVTVSDGSNWVVI
jgi:phage baseplate assembly protein gpV